ncbi:5'-methylthioadenosine/adenosylhomocysteine nucleosidase [Anaerobium acetethylicum]|uniref:adenosylhomocysteine nucleosidase n=1 Tax=Anaerobium acetethylicum TaxID=1619234 RepID=A0A1D3TRK9_9FIRM|nr:5'-methylthioadenosine/adenosylhomocysteine nucleosidase [Anaerobium acetethylicum]SCP96346.1 adenosylhomocysteine nucleosidase [Anaerobium acetethylicum]
MNRLGIIGAMEEEVEKLKELMDVKEVVKKASMEFYRGTLKGREAVVVRSGIGKVNAAVCTQILVDLFDVDAVINTGIAGSLQNRINIGDIVISSDALQHDVDATGFGYPLGEIPRMETLDFKADPVLVEAAKAACEEANPDISTFVGRIVSGDQFVSDKAVKEKLVENFQGYCTEMEGAAIAQAAYLNNVPFVIIRAISDKADDSATMDYPAFEKQAIIHSVRLVENLVSRL